MHNQLYKSVMARDRSSDLKPVGSLGVTDLKSKRHSELPKISQVNELRNTILPAS